MTMWKFFCSLFFFIVLINLSFGEDNFSDEEVIVKISKAYAGMEKTDCLFIKCERLRCKDVLRSKFSGGDIPLVWELGWGKNIFYATKTFFPTEFQKKDTNLLISEEPCTMIMKEKNILEWDSGRNVCYIDNFADRDINFVQEWELFELLGLNIAKNIIISAGYNYDDYKRNYSKQIGYDFLEDIYLNEGLENGNFIVKKEVGVLDGVPCIVIEKDKKDIIWLDHQKGFALLRRVLYDRTSGQIIYVANFSNHKKISNGFFFPGRISVNYYANPSDEPESNWGKIAKEIIYDITILNCDDLDSLLGVSLPIGTHVVDGIRKTEFTISNPNSDPFAGPIGQGIRANRFVMIRAIIIMIGSAMILFGVWLKFRKKGA